MNQTTVYPHFCYRYCVLCCKHTILDFSLRNNTFDEYISLSSSLKWRMQWPDKKRKKSKGTVSQKKNRTERGSIAFDAKARVRASNQNIESTKWRFVFFGKWPNLINGYKYDETVFRWFLIAVTNRLWLRRQWDHSIENPIWNVLQNEWKCLLFF